MNTDFPEYETNNAPLEPELREVTLIVDNGWFEHLQALSNTVEDGETFSWVRVEVI